MAEEAKNSQGSNNEGGLKGLYKKFVNTLMQEVQDFSAFMFLLIAIGSLVGSYFALKMPSFAFLPTFVFAFLGLLAHFSRAFALLTFIIIVALIIIL